jgi:hypothetical protein
MKMASTTQDELYRAFLAVSGRQTPALGDANAMLGDIMAQLRDVGSRAPTASQDSGGTGDATAMLADVIAQIGELRSSSPAPVAASRTQTAAQTTSNGGGISLGSVASTVLKSGFGLAPLISGLVGLFSGGDAEAPAPLVKYALPAAIDFQAAESRGQVTGVNYDQMGMPRSYAPASASGGASGAAPQITVNVQAMDARSFMDRSNDIALAVRDAMLNLNAINDVVNEL